MQTDVLTTVSQGESNRSMHKHILLGCMLPCRASMMTDVAQLELEHSMHNTTKRCSLGFHVLWFRCSQPAAVACHHFEWPNSMHSMHSMHEHGRFTMYGLSKEGVICHRHNITILNTQRPGGGGKLFCPQELTSQAPPQLSAFSVCCLSLLSQLAAPACCLSVLS